MASTRLRIGVVQFDPKLGQPQRNRQRVEQILEAVQPGSVDLLLLPEMALTGYVFRSPDAIRPFLEHPTDGLTTTFVRALARRFACTVIAGYPQVLAPDEAHTAHQVGANAALACTQDGAILTTYRKTNLYDVDLAWCVPGTGFAAFELPVGGRTVRAAMGICMDLNPARDAPAWSFEDGPFELAEFVLAQSARILVVLNAWLASDAGSADDGPDHSTIKYWVARLDPLWDASKGDRAVIVANRCGEEDGVVFAGSSVVLQYSAAKDRVSIVKSLGRTQEAVLRCTLEL